ncbi:Glycine/D-amino acid oxidase (deaminating) [Brevibacterium iodinum ATCC 49514]|uniref:Glycine/D-amino acid oxidase (Deaminating) n=1 Tax=Brevibacterium iodinum ATCC 49514 TaxID=1255616 RepID=A0A2H1JE84_9MICO|nr:FAD-dependent oxidoreductase [Brevibacterium iodinum]SMX85749.1 Glycine/D-amino acid oxidase (deaminating) [Brevibacterium iodinum ATCC 49514]SUW11211.1 Gamma-glutamylputrescine oxidoreductase [Brevibacterium iodinum]
MDVNAALADASTIPFWLDTDLRPEPLPPLQENRETDLLVVGGGFTGLWTALQAKERDPNRRVVLVEANSIGWAASGRNGGFCAASLTHGYDNGEAHLPEENDRLAQLGRENLDTIEATVAKYGMDVEFERTGELDVATEDYQVAELREAHDPDSGFVFLDQQELAGIVKSPTYKGALWDSREVALVHPAKLCWELLRVVRELGVEVYEGTKVTDVSDRKTTVEVATEPTGEAANTTGGGTGAAASSRASSTITAQRVALATNVFPSLLRRVSLHTVPVYDYALMTEPLNDEQMAAIGWEGRQGIGDCANRFHYYRLSADNRILFGGWDAVYHFGRQVSWRYDQRPETFETLAEHFFETFPQLVGLKFTHKWGGPIDTCSRFFSFFTSAYGKKVAMAAGFTGLGVGASRFAGTVMLDLLSGEDTELTELEMVRKLPLPFPPEPVAWLGIKMTTNALIKADENEGRRGPLLKVLDAVGMGFDS